MDVGDSGELVRRLNALGELYNVTLSPARKALYFEALRDLPFEAVAAALSQATRTCKFMPLPAEIRQLAVGDVEDAAESAWMAIRQAMQRAGAYASLVTDAAVGEAVLAVFGSWPEACALDLSPEMWASKRKEFGRVYRVLTQRVLTGSRYLVGVTEQQNGGRVEWLKFVPVFRLDGPAVERLSLADAETCRGQIAAIAHEFRRIGSTVDEAMTRVPRSIENVS